MNYWQNTKLLKIPKLYKYSKLRYSLTIPNIASASNSGSS